MSLEKYKYLTIEQNAIFELKERSSKFIGLSANIKNEEDAKTQIQQWHTDYPNATHICYGYRIGIEGKIYRANDDGEPSNSAGQPILGQIDAFNMTNVLVGVIRFYGGTKLGVGGLISAYKLAAKGVLDLSKTLEVSLMHHFDLTMNYIDMPLVMDWLKRNRLTIVTNTMELSCSVVVALEPTHEINWEEHLGMHSSLVIKDLGIY